MGIGSVLRYAPNVSDTTPRSMFGWCSTGKHGDCRRTLKGLGGPQSGVVRICGCTHPGCPCADHNRENPE